GSMCTNCDDVQHAVHAPHGTSLSAPASNSSSHSDTFTLTPSPSRGQRKSVGSPLQLPATLVHGDVVATAQQCQVPQAGRSTVRPELDVMGVAPGRRGSAAGELAMLVTQHEGSAKAVGHRAGATPEVEELAPASHHGPTERAVAQQPLGGRE